MADGRIVGTINLNRVKYTVREHMEGFQPPSYIEDCKALSRDVKHHGSRIPFYKGHPSGRRVTFQFNGVWCYVTQYDNQGNANIQSLLMEDLATTFEFTADLRLEEETLNSPFRM